MLYHVGNHWRITFIAWNNNADNVFGIAVHCHYLGVDEIGLSDENAKILMLVLMVIYMLSLWLWVFSKKNLLYFKELHSKLIFVRPF